MFKNCVFKASVSTKEWFRSTSVRCLKTFAESMLGFVTVGLAMQDIDWYKAVSVSCVAVIICILVSVKGIPEVESKEE